MSDEEIVKMLIKSQERMASQASDERKAQSDAFAKALHGLRMELRALFVLAMLVLAGLSGVQAAFKAPGIEASASPVSTAEAASH